MSKTIVAGALGNCVHVAGIVRFLAMAEELGYRTVFLGAAVPVDEFVDAIEREDPYMVGVSYRLTPNVGRRLVSELKAKLKAKGLLNRRFEFGGTPPVCAAVEELGWFERCFTGLEDPDEVWSYLSGRRCAAGGECSTQGQTLSDRLKLKSPYPLLRHHFGLPSLEDTLKGIKKIADSKVVDIISIAPDQNAQESLFRPSEMNPELDGAGGVPIRSEGDLKALYEASRSGNYPLLRIYSGTRDLIKWADLSQRTIRNAWAAIPLCWYNCLDGRSGRKPHESIAENQACIRWHAERGLWVEVNEAHQWSLRDAHDALSVAMAYIAAYNAKAMGVTHYVAQYMFNTPPSLDGAMDLAKILAQVEIVESLHSEDFTSVRQVRAGLLHLSPRLMQAKGQLAASTVLSMSVRPHIIHVVGYCEGDHAASADDVIESCEIVRGVLRNTFRGMPDLTIDPAVEERKRHLIREAGVIISALKSLGSAGEDALTSPMVIQKAIQLGILDAPHLKRSEYSSGRLTTRIVKGALDAVDKASGKPISEADRIASLGIALSVAQRG